MNASPLRTNSLPLSLVSVLAILFSALHARADLIGSWNASDGSWHNAANWTPNAVPTGLGTVKISNNGTARITEAAGDQWMIIVLGNQTNTSGTLIVAGENPSRTELRLSSIYVGSDQAVGNGTFILNGNAFLNTNQTFVGFHANAKGWVAASGWTGFISYSDLCVGLYGYGNVSFSENTQVSTHRLRVGAGRGSTGEVSISGNSIIGTQSNYQPNVYIGMEGNASMAFSGNSRVKFNTLTVGISSPQAMLSTADNARIASGNISLAVEKSANVTLSLRGGSIETAFITKGQGKLAFSAENTTIKATENAILLNNLGDIKLGRWSSIGLIIDSNGYDISTLGTNFRNDGFASFIKTGEGTLSIPDGNHSIAMGHVNAGTLRLSGNSSLETSVDILVAENGNASLDISGQARASALHASIGCNPDTQGSLVLSGNASLSVSTSLFIGQNGTGTLSLGGNASILSDEGNDLAVLGSNFDTQGIASVSGNARWVTGRQLIVGGLGQGNLSISEEGSVRNKNATVGQLSTGNVMLSGNASWDIEGTLVIGDNGNASISLLGTPRISATKGISLAVQNTSKADLTLTGGTIEAPFIAKGQGLAFARLNKAKLCATANGIFLDGIDNISCHTSSGDYGIFIDTGSNDISTRNTVFQITGSAPFVKDGTGNLSLSGSQHVIPYVQIYKGGFTLTNSSILYAPSLLTSTQGNSTLRIENQSALVSSRMGIGITARPDLSTHIEIVGTQAVFRATTINTRSPTKLSFIFDASGISKVEADQTLDLSLLSTLTVNGSAYTGGCLAAVLFKSGSPSPQAADIIAKLKAGIAQNNLGFARGKYRLSVTGNPSSAEIGLRITALSSFYTDQDQLLLYALCDDYDVNPNGRLVHRQAGSTNHIPRVKTNDDNAPYLSFTPIREELSYEVQHSTDLVNWRAIGTWQGEPSRTEPVFADSEFSYDEQPRQFLRLKVIPPQE